MDLLLSIGGFFLMAALIFDVVSLASLQWVVAQGSSSGLWTKCYRNGSCATPTKSDRLDSVRGLMIVSVVVAGLTFIIAAIEVASSCITHKLSRWSVHIITVANFVAGILTLVAILLAKDVPWGFSDTSYGYSYWLGVVAIILFFVAEPFFLATSIRNERLRKHRQELQQETVPQKSHLFNIPHYDYKSKRNDQPGKPGTYSEGKRSRQDQIPSVDPFQFDSRHYPPSYLANEASFRDGFSVINTDLRSHRFGSESGFPAKQLSGQQMLNVRNNLVDEYQGSDYSRSQDRPNTSMSGNSRSTSVPPGFIIPSLFGRGKPSPRAQTDTFGFSQNYSRHY